MARPSLANLAHVLVRAVLGFGPKTGTNIHNFAVGAVARCFAEAVRPIGNTCPLCGLRARTRTGLLYHIVKSHWFDILEIIDTCYRSSGKR